ncbi:MAG: MogA/MoaB family molybdenum cofactor biosynthesis protein [Candidatus Hodarchaeales archaeon]|jgi:molybdenum cofactor biosynthesis protein B
MTTREKHILDRDIPLSATIIVVSDSLSAAGRNWKKLDTSAKKAAEILTDNGVTVSKTLVIADEIDQIQGSIRKEITEETSLIVTIGGTGIASRDVTIEAVLPLVEKKLPGYGELFRMKTFEEVGTVSIMTRALAGVTGKSCVACLPGSTNAVILGIKLIVKELLHIMNLRR